MLKYFLGLCMLLVCSVFSPLLLGQNPTASIQVQNREIFIGDHLNINCVIIAPNNSDIKALDLKEALEKGGWELLFVGEASGSVVDGNKAQFSLPVTVTTWEEGKKDIPSLSFSVNGRETIQSNTVNIEIKVPPTVNEAYVADIKSIYTVETSWLDYWPYAVMAILALALIAVLYVLYGKYKDGTLFKKNIALSPEEEALQELEALQSSNLLAENKVVEYHTQMALILRTYIFKRSKIDTLHQATNAFLPKVKQNAYFQSTSEAISEVLDTADLVKFAKASPLPAAHTFAADTITNTVHTVKQILEQEAALKTALKK